MLKKSVSWRLTLHIKRQRCGPETFWRALIVFWYMCEMNSSSSTEPKNGVLVEDRNPGVFGSMTTAIVYSCRALRQISIQGLCGRRPPPLIVPKNSLFLLQRTGEWVIRGRLGHYPNISGIKKNIPLWKPLVSSAPTYQNNRTTPTCNCQWMASCVSPCFTWIHLNASVLVSNCSLSKQSKPRMPLQWGD